MFERQEQIASSVQGRKQIRPQWSDWQPSRRRADDSCSRTSPTLRITTEGLYPYFPQKSQTAAQALCLYRFCKGRVAIGSLGANQRFEPVMHRLFVAIRPPEHIRGQLLDLMEGVPDIRWQHDEQLHLTLRFIGEVERPFAEDLAAALARIRFEPFQLSLDGVGAFEKRRHGALWAGISPKTPLKALNAKIERVCQAVGLGPEHRAYHPHITLARWKGRAPGLDRFMERHGGLGSPPWLVEEFILYESQLGREGAHYDPVTEYTLRS